MTDARSLIAQAKAVAAANRLAQVKREQVQKAVQDAVRRGT